MRWQHWRRIGMAGVLGMLLAGCAEDRAGPPDVAAGQRAFAKCASCHQIGPSARAAFGPQLNGIVNRRAGATPDFRYSSAMRTSGIVWTPERLAAFLRDPGAVVPGTSMRFGGIRSAQQIADLIAYLDSAGKTGADR
jgi:cytochrome c